MKKVKCIDTNQTGLTFGKKYNVLQYSPNYIHNGLIYSIPVLTIRNDYLLTQKYLCYVATHNCIKEVFEDISYECRNEIINKILK